MFQMTMLKHYNGAIRKLQFKKNPAAFYDGDPRMNGLGHYTDVQGVKWDVNGIVNKHILARRVDDSFRYSTENSSFAPDVEEYEWIPYEVEMID